MGIENTKLVEDLKSVFKLSESPIAFFYTDIIPDDVEVYKPKKPKTLTRFPCIIQFLNGVRHGKTLVLGKQSRHLCPGGASYLGLRRRFSGAEYYLSTGFTSSKEGAIALEGERVIKTPQLAKEFYDTIPFKKSPAKYAVFMPLHAVNLEIYKPLLVIFFVNMDQLAGLVQLANFDTITNRTILGISSGCGAITTEPLAELSNLEFPRPVVGMLTDIIARSHVKAGEATFTIGFDRLLQLHKNIDDSFLKLDAWKAIHDRI